MTTAQVLFEQYKVLPQRIRRELKQMIDEAEKPAPKQEEDEDDDDTGDTIRISMKALKDSIREVKKLKAGKQKVTSWDDFLKELNDGQRA